MCFLIIQRHISGAELKINVSETMKSPLQDAFCTQKRSDQNDSKVQILSAVYVFQKMIQATVPCDIALKENARIEQKDNILVKILEYLGYFGSVAW